VRELVERGIIRIVGEMGEDILELITNYIQSSKYFIRVFKTSSFMDIEITIPVLAYYKENLLLLGPIILGNILYVEEVIPRYSGLHVLGLLHSHYRGPSCPTEEDLISMYRLKANIIGVYDSPSETITLYEVEVGEEKFQEYRRCYSGRLEEYIMSTGGQHSGPIEQKILAEITCECFRERVGFRRMVKVKLT